MSALALFGLLVSGLLCTAGLVVVLRPPQAPEDRRREERRPHHAVREEVAVQRPGSTFVTLEVPEPRWRDSALE